MHASRSHGATPCSAPPRSQLGHYVHVRQFTALAILTQSIGRVAADPLLSLSSGLYEVTSRLELPHLERWAIDKKTRIRLFSHEENDANSVAGT